jgi:hypothetical protein
MDLFGQQQVSAGQAGRFTVEFAEFELDQEQMIASASDFQNMLFAPELIGLGFLDRSTAGTSDDGDPIGINMHFPGFAMAMGHFSTPVHIILHNHFFNQHKKNDKFAKSQKWDG